MPLTGARQPLYWLIAGAFLGLGASDLSVSLPYLMVGALMALYGTVRLGLSGCWAALVGFGSVPALVFGFHVATSPAPCPPDLLYPGAPCADPNARYRVGILLFGLIAFAGLCIGGGRKLELAGGVLAGIACVVTGIYAAFWPLSTFTTCSNATNSIPPHCVTISSSFWQQGTYADVVLALFLGIVGFAFLAGSAYLHAVHDDQLGLGLLWTGAVLLTATSVVGMFSIGIFTIVPAVFTLAAAIGGTASLRSNHLDTIETSS